MVAASFNMHKGPFGRLKPSGIGLRYCGRNHAILPTHPMPLCDVLQGRTRIRRIQ